MGDKLTKFKSGLTVLTDTIANSWFGGLFGTAEGAALDPLDPLVAGHVHDGEHYDGHAQKINLSDHVTGEIQTDSIADGAVTIIKLDPGIPLEDTLAETLIFGNTTEGTDIEVSSGDRIVGEDAPVGSKANGNDLVLRGGLGDAPGTDAAVKVEGKLTVTGVIDPTAIIFEKTNPYDNGDLQTTGTQGAFYVDDGNASSIWKDDTPYYMSSGVPDLTSGPVPLILGNLITPLFGGYVTYSSAAAPPIISVPLPGAGGFPTVLRGQAMWIAELNSTTTSLTQTATLPAASTASGRVVTFRHIGSGNNTSKIASQFGDSINGDFSAEYIVPYGATVSFISDGVGDWRVIKSPVEATSFREVIQVAGGVTTITGYSPAFDSISGGFNSPVKTIVGVKVMMDTVNTVGTHTLELSKNGGGTIISPTSFQLTGLTDGIPAFIDLTNIGADLEFADTDVWTAVFTSGSGLYDGSNIQLTIMYG